MKQYISIEQINEYLDMPKESRKKLHAWCKSKGYLEDKSIVPLLTIGQMIGYLEEHLGCWYKPWIIGGYDVAPPNASELCDALWEAVKSELNK
jgi:hypothetical protein